MKAMKYPVTNNAPGASIINLKCSKGELDSFIIPVNPDTGKKIMVPAPGIFRTRANISIMAARAIPIPSELINVLVILILPEKLLISQCNTVYHNQGNKQAQTSKKFRNISFQE